jgi:hypothetical protein
MSTPQELIELVKLNDSNRVKVDLWRKSFETTIVNEMFLNKLTLDPRAQGFQAQKLEGIYQEILDEYFSKYPEIGSDMELIFGDKVNTLWVQFATISISGNHSFGIWVAKYEQNYETEYEDKSPQLEEVVKGWHPFWTSLTLSLMRQAELNFDSDMAV